jgi:hypothetical protein
MEHPEAMLEGEGAPDLLAVGRDTNLDGEVRA